MTDKVTKTGDGYAVRLTEAEFRLILDALGTHWNEEPTEEGGRDAKALLERLTD